MFADFQTDLVLQHHRYLGAANQEAAAVAHRMAGVWWDSCSRASTGIPLTGAVKRTWGLVEGTFKPYDISFGLSYARAIGERLGVGLTAKMIHSEIDIYSDTGLAFDFFLSHQAMIEGLTFGASATNMGSDMNLYTVPYPMPTAYRVGASYSPVGEGLMGRLTVAGDISFPNDTKEKGHFGAELELLPELTLRGGTRVNYDLLGWTAGAGFKPLPNMALDYAYQNSKVDGFDDAHKFSLSMVW